MDEYETVMKLVPGDVYFLKDIGYVYRDPFKEYDLSEEMHNRAYIAAWKKLKSDPYNSTLRFCLANLYTYSVSNKFHDYPKAVEQFNEILKRDDKNDAAYFYLADLEFQYILRWGYPRSEILKGLSRMTFYCKKALELNPYNFRAAQGLCRTYINYNENKKDAIKWVKNAQRRRWHDWVFIEAYSFLLADVITKLSLFIGLGLLIFFKLFSRSDDHMRYIVLLNVILWLSHYTH